MQISPGAKAQIEQCARGVQSASHLSVVAFRTVSESQRVQTELLEHYRQWEREEDELQRRQEPDCRKVVGLGQPVQLEVKTEQVEQLLLQLWQRLVVELPRKPEGQEVTQLPFTVYTNLGGGQMSAANIM